MLASKERRDKQAGGCLGITARCNVIPSLYTQAPQFSGVGCYVILQRGHWPDVVLVPGLSAAQCDDEECVQDERRQRRAMQVLYFPVTRGGPARGSCQSTMPWMGRREI
jgi:hypothetical protein